MYISYKMYDTDCIKWNKLLLALKHSTCWVKQSSISEGGLFPHLSTKLYWTWEWPLSHNHLIDVPSTSFNPFNFSKARAMGVSTGFCRGKKYQYNCRILHSFATILLFHHIFTPGQFPLSISSWCVAISDLSTLTAPPWDSQFQLWSHGLTAEASFLTDYCPWPQQTYIVTW